MKIEINGNEIQFDVISTPITINEIKLYESLENSSFYNLISKYIKLYYELLIDNSLNDDSCLLGDIYDTLMNPIKYKSYFSKLCDIDSTTMKNFLKERKDVEMKIHFIKAYILILRSNEKLTFDEFKSSHIPFPIVAEISKLYDTI